MIMATQVKSKLLTPEEREIEFQEKLQKEIPPADVIAAYKRALTAEKVEFRFDKVKKERVEVKFPDHITQIRAADALTLAYRGTPHKASDVDDRRNEQTDFDRIVEKAVTDPELFGALKATITRIEAQIEAKKTAKKKVVKSRSRPS